MHGSRNVLLVVCGVLMLVAVIANAAMKFYNVQVLIDNDKWIAHTHAVKARVNSLLSSFVDSESGMRGFVISENAEFLKAYHLAQERIDHEFQLLADLTIDNPAQQGEVAKLRALHDRHQEFLKETQSLYFDKGAPAACESIKSGRGKAIMQKMREVVGVLVSAEDELLATRIQVAHDRYRQAIVTGIIGTTLSLAIAAISIYFVWQELGRRREAESAFKAQAEAARVSAERFRLLTETVPVHIWIANPDGAVVFFNKNWRAYTGLEVDAEGLAHWLTAVHPEDVDWLNGIWAKADGGSHDLYLHEIRVRRGADLSYRWHRCAIVPVRTRKGSLQSWVGSLADVQDQKDRAEALDQAVRLQTQELRRTNNILQEEILERIRAEDRATATATELRRSNEELEKFAYVASHDLQEPLRKIQAFGDRLLRKNREQLDDVGRGYLDRVLVAATRMRTLIDDLLTFSRVASTMRPYVTVDLNVTLAEVLADLESTLAQAQGHVEAKPLPMVAADPLQMRQLLQNLIGNALKFAKPGKPPHITIEAVPLGNLAADADPPPPGFPGWRLSFADRGIGFDQVHERRIFELFQRLHGRDQYTGTGIGLAICRKIVERHSGAIHARGQQGIGATFYVDLPEAPPTTFVVPT
jgi:PAS domain S-box-containing protein